MDDLTDDQPVEEHPQCRQMLLDGRRGVVGCQLRQVTGHVIALDGVQAQLIFLRPGEGPHGVMMISRLCVLVGEIVSEEGEKPLGGFLAWSAMTAGRMKLLLVVGGAALTWDVGTSSVLMPGLSGDNVRYAVVCDMAVTADEPETLMPGLGDQQAVEGIAVVMRKRFHGEGMGNGHG